VRCIVYLHRHARCARVLYRAMIVSVTVFLLGVNCVVALVAPLALALSFPLVYEVSHWLTCVIVVDSFDTACCRLLVSFRFHAGFLFE